MTKKLYKLMDWAEIETVVYSEEDKPHDFLGAHRVSGGLLVQAFFPNVKKVYVVFKNGNSTKEYAMELADEEGFYAAYISMPIPSSKYVYFYRVVYKDGVVKEIEDPYRFPQTIEEDVLNRYNAGILYNSYEYLGAHIRKINGVDGVSFAVFAPNAVRVSVVGDFNNWDGRTHQMRRLSDSGIFEIFIPQVNEGDKYKYEIKFKGGMIALKSDPYGFYSEIRPDTASIVKDLSSYKWDDDNWVARRSDVNGKEKPMSIYEVHLGSVYKNDDGSFMNYRKIAPILADYVIDMGYTHIELMPVMEHLNDFSFGYDVTGYYSATSRYGTTDDLMYFVDYMHKKGIAVIFDFVPSHFPKDDSGLSYFDGTYLYEPYDERQRFRKGTNTLNFDYGRKEVSNFLISSALFWINIYHADGLRIDSLSSMLYLDYDKADGEWSANIYGGNENLNAVEFCKHLISINEKAKTGAVIIAEESSAWPNVTSEFDKNGLGFDYKWNTGFKSDFLDFMGYDPYFRAHHFDELTFSMIYAYSEKFILSISHDDVINGKSSLMNKMPGNWKDKFCNLRAAYGYMFTHPGKKLSFMGQDIAEFDEWNVEREVEWDLLEYDEHKEFNLYIKDLLHFYKKHPALFEKDFMTDGFEWINNISASENVISFLRKSKGDNEILLVVLNFANKDYENYKVGVPFAGKYKEIFSSDLECYGGCGLNNKRVKSSKKIECDGRDNSIAISVPSLSVSIFRCEQSL